MPTTFQKPTISKKGADNAYVFRIETDNPLTADTENVVAACAQNPLYLNDLLTEFLRSCASYFKNTTSVANVLKLLKHQVEPSAAEAPYVLTPLEIVICKGSFTMSWKVSGELLKLDFPVEETDLLPTDADTIPFANTNEVIHIEPRGTHTRSELDRTRVKEAHLRAKLAVYKANRAHLEYIEKYGEEPSDSDEDEEDDSEEEDSEEED
jgi:hypothetical protein